MWYVMNAEFCEVLDLDCEFLMRKKYIPSNAESLN